MDLIKQRCNNSNALATGIRNQVVENARKVRQMNVLFSSTLGHFLRLPLGVTDLFLTVSMIFAPILFAG